MYIVGKAFIQVVTVNLIIFKENSPEEIGLKLTLTEQMKSLQADNNWSKII